jgi:hypothetical protein
VIPQRRRLGVWRFIGIVPLLALLAACGGNDGNEEPADPIASPLPLPAAGGSRWAALERDDDGDGLAEQITRYGYDALGRRTLQTTWRAEDGIPAGEPIEVQDWTYDSASRLLTHSVRDTRGARQTTATYGAAGLLASTRLRWEGSTTARTTTFTWQNLRMVGTLTDDRQPLTELAFYGTDGLVERIERRFGDDEEVDVDRYQWRPDAQLAGSSFSLSVGNLILYGMSYDADGRITRSTKTDDGIEDEMRRYAQDDRGRLQRIEVDSRPSSFADKDFAGDMVYRIRWEAGLCQPTYRVELPPNFDRQVTMQTRPDGTTLGCAP